MNKESAERIMKSADGKVLSDYIASKIKSLDSCQTELTNPIEIAVEMKAREKAVNVLAEILNDLLIGREQEFEVFDKKEYAVDV